MGHAQLDHAPGIVLGRQPMGGNLLPYLFLNGRGGAGLKFRAQLITWRKEAGLQEPTIGLAASLGLRAKSLLGLELLNCALAVPPLSRE